MMRDRVFVVEPSPKFYKQIKKIDKLQAKRIWLWIEMNLNHTRNPRAHGKALKGHLKSFWCYRIGKYRIIAEINDQQLILILLEVAHRKEVYE